MLEETFRVPWPHHHRAAHERPLASPRRTSHHSPLSPLSSGHKGFISASLMLQAPSHLEDFVPTPRSVFTTSRMGGSPPVIPRSMSPRPRLLSTAGELASRSPISRLHPLAQPWEASTTLAASSSVYQSPFMRIQAPQGHKHCPFPLCPQLLEHPLWGLQQGFDEWIDDCL